jgi:hypothetical protein
LIKLSTIEERVTGELGKVYSTAPEVAIGSDGKTYYIKGCNNPTAFSEIAGCRLARLAGLRVPNADVGEFAGALYAAVESVPRANRNIRPWLTSPERIDNWLQVFEVVAVDTWLVNDDRNMGNLVGSSTMPGRIEMYMIDFEKSRALGDQPFMSSGAVDPKRLWPTAELGSVLRHLRPDRCPPTVLDRIRSISVDEIREVILPLAADLPFVNWQESSIDLLDRRARKIDTLVEEVWAQS